jgi:NAD+ kinase
VTDTGADPFDRIGVVVHPSRDLSNALEALRRWADGGGAELVQVRADGQQREVAPAGEAADCDLVIALGGDGTTLAAIHAAGPVKRPVLGVACGSLGALSAVSAAELPDALDRVSTGDWTPRPIGALVADHGDDRFEAVNDLVLIRAGAGQVAVEVQVHGERVIRFAGDGLVAATSLGSTAYTLAAGGPMLVPGMTGLVLTPLAAHGGVCPPLVCAPDTPVMVTLNPGHGGARIEVDGQIRAELDHSEPVAFALGHEPEFAVLVSLGGHESVVSGLRRRGLIVDSPRVTARDEREAAAMAKAGGSAGRDDALSGRDDGAEHELADDQGGRQLDGEQRQ